MTVLNARTRWRCLVPLALVVLNWAACSVSGLNIREDIVNIATAYDKVAPAVYPDGDQPQHGAQHGQHGNNACSSGKDCLDSASWVKKAVHLVDDAAREVHKLLGSQKTQSGGLNLHAYQDVVAQVHRADAFLTSPLPDQQLSASHRMQLQQAEELLADAETRLKEAAGYQYHGAHQTAMQELQTVLQALDDAHRFLYQPERGQTGKRRHAMQLPSLIASMHKGIQALSDWSTQLRNLEVYPLSGKSTPHEQAAADARHEEANRLVAAAKQAIESLKQHESTDPTALGTAAHAAVQNAQDAFTAARHHLEQWQACGQQLHTMPSHTWLGSRLKKGIQQAASAMHAACTALARRGHDAREAVSESMHAAGSYVTQKAKDATAVSKQHEDHWQQAREEAHESAEEFHTAKDMAAEAAHHAATGAVLGGNAARHAVQHAAEHAAGSAVHTAQHAQHAAVDAAHHAAHTAQCAQHAAAGAVHQAAAQGKGFVEGVGHTAAQYGHAAREGVAHATGAVHDTVLHAADATREGLTRTGKASHDAAQAARDRASHAAVSAKDAAQHAAACAKDAASQAACAAKDAMAQAGHAAHDAVHHAADAVRDRATRAADAVHHAASAAKDKAWHAADKTRDELEHAAGAAREVLSHAGKRVQHGVDHVKHTADHARHEAEAWTHAAGGRAAETGHAVGDAAARARHKAADVLSDGERKAQDAAHAAEIYAHAQAMHVTERLKGGLHAAEEAIRHGAIRTEQTVEHGVQGLKGPVHHAQQQAGAAGHAAKHVAGQIGDVVSHVREQVQHAMGDTLHQIGAHVPHMAHDVGTALGDVATTGREEARVAESAPFGVPVPYVSKNAVGAGQQPCSPGADVEGMVHTGMCRMLGSVTEMHHALMEGTAAPTQEPVSTAGSTQDMRVCTALNQPPYGSSLFVSTMDWWLAPVRKLEMWLGLRRKALPSVSVPPPTQSTRKQAQYGTKGEISPREHLVVTPARVSGSLMPIALLHPAVQVLLGVCPSSVARPASKSHPVTGHTGVHGWRGARSTRATGQHAPAAATNAADNVDPQLRKLHEEVRHLVDDVRSYLRTHGFNDTAEGSPAARLPHVELTASLNKTHNTRKHHPSLDVLSKAAHTAAALQHHVTAGSEALQAVLQESLMGSKLLLQEVAEKAEGAAKKVLHGLSGFKHSSERASGKEEMAAAAQ